MVKAIDDTEYIVLRLGKTIKMTQHGLPLHYKTPTKFSHIVTRAVWVAGFSLVLYHPQCRLRRPQQKARAAQ